MRILSYSVLVIFAACNSSKSGAPPAETGTDTAPDTGDSVESDTDTPCTPATEIPYDGIDQDCDGTDLKDVDGDGADAVEADGTDCDDANDLIHPGATEVPYDGKDQDCDGVDQTDVDGDGYDSTRVDGDDCDDLNPDIHPGVEEVPGDGVDQDCDGEDPIDPDHGYTPDAVICGDGTGDYTTIQAAVDAVPDGSVLAICPGTYEEYVTMVDRELVLYGQTTDPGEVIINGQSTGSAGFSVSGPEAQATITWMTVLGGANSASLDARDDATTMVDTVDFCGDGYLGTQYGINALGAYTAILRSRVCGVYLIMAGSGDVGMTILEDTIPSFTSDDPDDKLSIISMHNNIVIGTDSFMNLGNNGNIYLYNNTFAAPGLIMRVYLTYQDETMPNVYVQDNIFNATGRAGYALWYVYLTDYRGRGDGYPAYFSNNILWNIEGGLGMLVDCDYIYAYACITDYSMSAWIEKRNIEADPMFEYTTEMGSYGLGAGSPATDAGLGDTDADGTTNDIGAFGGPDGNWWGEVPWLLN